MSEYDYDEADDWDEIDIEGGIPIAAAEPATIVGTVALQVPTEHMIYLIAKNIAQPLMSKYAEEIRQATIAVVLAELDKVVASAVNNLLELDVRQRIPYGEEKQPTTLRSVLEGDFQRVLNQRVNGNGDVTQYCSSSDPTRLEWIVQRAIASVVDKRMRDEVDKAVAEIRREASTKMMDTIKDAIKRHLNLG